MTDIYLQLAMQGELNKSSSKSREARKELKKDRYEQAYDKLLDSLVDQLGLLDTTPQNQLIPPRERRARIKENLRNSTQFLNVDVQLAPALEILGNKAKCEGYLNLHEYKEMATQLSKIPFYLKQVDFSQPNQKKLSSSLHITDATMQAILKVGLAKYNEKEYQSSASIFALLFSLDHENDTYWYRFGITSYQMRRLDLALYAFAYALYLNAGLLGARLFSADCYLQLNQIDDAKIEVEEAKRIVEKTSPEPIWLDLLSDIEKRIQKEPIACKK